MSRETLLNVIENKRTRPAQFLGEPIFVKVYSSQEFKAIAKKTAKMVGKAFAKFLADQFFDENDEKVFTADFLLSKKCPDCVTMELTEMFMDVNEGTYKKK